MKTAAAVLLALVLAGCGSSAAAPAPSPASSPPASFTADELKVQALQGCPLTQADCKQVTDELIATTASVCGDSIKELGFVNTAKANPRALSVFYALCPQAKADVG